MAGDRDSIDYEAVGNVERANSLPQLEARRWRTLAREPIYATPWRTLVKERVLTHTGAIIEDFTVVEAPDAVLIVPVTVTGAIVLIRQYRQTLEDWIIEVPAGGIAPGREPLEVARQELLEEIGGVAARLDFVGTYTPSTGHLRHWSHVVLATGVTISVATPESTELIETIEVDLATALAWARPPARLDGESALALLWCEPLIRAELARRGA